MKSAHLALFRIVALAFLLPGLAGLVISAFLSSTYLDTLPASPMPAEMRTTPRTIHGVVVYQTPEEDRRLNLMEYSSVGIFLVGLGLSIVYLERWGRARSLELERRELSPAEDLGR
jgi:hypothetical protein